MIHLKLVLHLLVYILDVFVLLLGLFDDGLILSLSVVGKPVLNLLLVKASFLAEIVVFLLRQIRVLNLLKEGLL